MHPRQPILFDRATGHLTGATITEQLVTCALQAGSRATALYHHRGFSVGCHALSAVIGRQDIIVQLDADARFAFPLGDGYWSLLLDRSFRYEHEIDRILKAVADVDYTFVDCGANFGFWSVLTTSPHYGSHPAIAIEASHSNYQKLVRNAGLNGRRFQTLHRAIGAAPGRAWLHGSKHEAFSIRGSDDDDAGEFVEVITLDDLLDEDIIRAGQRLIVKLDVEGMEIAAIKSGQRLLEREVMLVVEDHGSDRAHSVSRYLLDKRGFSIFVLDPQSEDLVALRELSALDRIKENASIGYNIFATNSRFWRDRLSAIPRSA